MTEEALNDDDFRIVSTEDADEPFRFVMKAPKPKVTKRRTLVRRGLRNYKSNIPLLFRMMR